VCAINVGGARAFLTLPSMPQNGPLLASPGTHLGPRLGSREEVALPGTRSGQGLWLWEVADKPARTARVPGWLRPADPLAEHLLAPLGALGGVAPACEPPLERKRAVVRVTFASPQSGDARAHRRASQSPACWCYHAPVPLSGRVLRVAKAAVDLSASKWRHLFRFAERLIVVNGRCLRHALKLTAFSGCINRQGDPSPPAEKQIANPQQVNC
jgi:hypothetical protein